VHPHECAEFDDADVKELRRLAAHPNVRAIGETGLDFHRWHVPRDAQEAAFAAQCDLAAELRLPVVVHARDSLDAIALVLEAHPIPAGVMHSFTGGPSAAGRFLDLGLHISLSGIVTFKNAEDVRATAAALPQDRLMLETDAPFLAPAPQRGRRNEPALLVHTAAQVAASRGISVPSVSAFTTRNAQAVFASD
jgi:TatD DNase family protein